MMVKFKNKSEIIAAVSGTMEAIERTVERVEFHRHENSPALIVEQYERILQELEADLQDLMKNFGYRLETSAAV